MCKPNSRSSNVLFTHTHTHSAATYTQARLTWNKSKKTQPRSIWEKYFPNGKGHPIDVDNSVSEVNVNSFFLIKKTWKYQVRCGGAHIISANKKAKGGWCKLQGSLGYKVSSRALWLQSGILSQATARWIGRYTGGSRRGSPTFAWVVQLVSFFPPK